MMVIKGGQGGVDNLCPRAKPVRYTSLERCATLTVSGLAGICTTKVPIVPLHHTPYTFTIKSPQNFNMPWGKPKYSIKDST